MQIQVHDGIKGSLMPIPIPTFSMLHAACKATLQYDSLIPLSAESRGHAGEQFIIQYSLSLYMYTY